MRLLHGKDKVVGITAKNNTCKHNRKYKKSSTALEVQRWSNKSNFKIGGIREWRTQQKTDYNKGKSILVY